MATITTAEVTNQLRFLEKETVFTLGGETGTHKVRILQQAWHIISRDGKEVRGEVEWRDVPLVLE